MSKMVAKTIPQGEDKTAIQLEEDGVPLAHIILDPPELEQFIDQLQLARAALSDAVPSDLDIGTRLAVQIDPRWAVRHDPDRDMKVLALRHPGLGWMGFLLPLHEAEAMAKVLSQSASPDNTGGAE
jgi:hypothetical protein